MKNAAKFLGIIALAAVIGLSMMGCPNEDDTGGNTMTWTELIDNPFDRTYIFAITYGNDKFVAMGGANKTAYSSDGITWTSGTGFLSGNTLNNVGIRGIAYGTDKFVAVGSTYPSSSYTPRIGYSTDGITWTSVENTMFGSNVQINAVAWGNNKFVAVGSSGKIAYSADGITWTAVTNSRFSNTTINAVVWGDDKFVAVGENGKMAYSADGETWTTVTNSGSGFLSNDNSSIRAVTYGNGKFVAGGYNYDPSSKSNSSHIAYSADGVTWTAVTNSTFGSGFYARIYAITYGKNKFIAGGDESMAYSTDGETWTAVAKSVFEKRNMIIYGIACGSNMFVAVGYSNTTSDTSETGGRMAYSDGEIK